MHAVVHVRAGAGGWSQDLLEHAQEQPHPPLRLQVQGPYPSTLDFLPPSACMVMVAGGMGITPLLGLLRMYARMHAAARGDAAALHGPAAAAHPPPTSNALGAVGEFSALRVAGDVELAKVSRAPHELLPAALSPDPSPTRHRANAASNGAGTMGTHTVNGHGGPMLSCAGQLFSGSTGPTAINGMVGGDPAMSVSGQFPGQYPTCAPRHVHLVWSVRSLDELTLLGSDLLEEACSGNPPWLTLSLHYTGFEQEAAVQRGGMGQRYGQYSINGGFCTAACGRGQGLVAAAGQALSACTRAVSNGSGSCFGRRRGRQHSGGGHAGQQVGACRWALRCCI